MNLAQEGWVGSCANCNESGMVSEWKIDMENLVMYVD